MCELSADSKKQIDAAPAVSNNSLMIQLTPQQIEAVSAGGDHPPTMYDPNTQTTYVLLRKDAYEQLTAASQIEVERLASAIDWETARATLHAPQDWFDGDEPKPF